MVDFVAQLLPEIGDLILAFAAAGLGVVERVLLRREILFEFGGMAALTFDFSTQRVRLLLAVPEPGSEVVDDLFLHGGLSLRAGQGLEIALFAAPTRVQLVAQPCYCRFQLRDNELPAGEPLSERGQFRRVFLEIRPGLAKARPGASTLFVQTQNNVRALFECGIGGGKLGAGGSKNGLEGGGTFLGAADFLFQPPDFLFAGGAGFCL